MPCACAASGKASDAEITPAYNKCNFTLLTPYDWELPPERRSRRHRGNIVTTTRIAAKCDKRITLKDARFIVNAATAPILSRHISRHTYRNRFIIA
jgi:hypothetical protein